MTANMSHWVVLALETILCLVSVTRSELQLVQLIHRHGDRSPLKFFDTDPNKGAWPVGPGELINKGKAVMFELGKYLRVRYEGFLPDAYEPRDVSVRSSATSRTFMSAACLLAGLYPPHDQQIWNEKLPWQPIPIFTILKELDNMLQLSATCPQIDRESKRAMLIPEVATFNDVNKQFYKQLSNLTGENVTSFDDASPIYDVLLNEALNNMTLPIWVNNETTQRLEQIQQFSLDFLTCTPLLKRLRGGVLLREILLNMDRSIDKKQTTKMFVYSGHDTTISSFLNTIEGTIHFNPPYASLVIIELHVVDGRSRVQIYYKNSTHDPFPITINNCTFDCPLEKFSKLLEPVTPGDWQEECNSNAWKFPAASKTYLLVAVITGYFSHRI